MYNDMIMELIRNPKHTGELKDANAVGQIGNAACGDILRVYLKVKDNIIEDASFLTYGCGAAIASSSIAMSMIIGKSVDEALSLTNKDFINALGELPPQKIHCSVLADEAIKAAVDNYKENINR